MLIYFTNVLRGGRLDGADAETKLLILVAAPWSPRAQLCENKCLPLRVMPEERR